MRGGGATKVVNISGQETAAQQEAQAEGGQDMAGYSRGRSLAVWRMLSRTA